MELGRGQVDVEDGSPAFHSIEADRTAEACNDFLHDAEPKPGTALLPGIRCIGLGKFLENARAKDFRNPLAAIGHADTISTIERPYGHGNRFSPPRKLDRVRQQVRHDLHQAVLVGQHSGIGRERLYTERYIVLTREPGRLMHSRIEQWCECERSNIELHPPRLDLFDIENVVDQPDKPGCITMRNFDQPPDFGRHLARCATIYQAERAGNRRKRCTKLMADGGDKFAFHLLDFAAFAYIAQHRYKAGPVGEIDRADRDFQRENRPIAASAEEFLNTALVLATLGLEPGEESLDLSTIWRDFKQDADIAPQERTRTSAEHGCRCGIYAFDTAAGVEHDHAIHRAVEDRFLPRRHIAGPAQSRLPAQLAAQDQQTGQCQQEDQPDFKPQRPPLELLPIGFGIGGAPIQHQPFDFG